MALNFRVASNTISKLVPETCEANIKELIVCPSTPERWKAIAEGFSNTWNFQQTIGAFDGKHIVLQPLANTGSYYYNYKGYHSIILLALVDSKGKFTYVDVGANGSYTIHRAIFEQIVPLLRTRS